MKVMKALNDHSKTFKGAKILLLGLAYKANVDDDRESPSYRLIEKLEELGAGVSYNDPYIPVIRLTRQYAKYAQRQSVEINGAFDLMLIATAHDQYKSMALSLFKWVSPPPLMGGVRGEGDINSAPLLPLIPLLCALIISLR